MRTIHFGRLLSLATVLALGVALGGALAVAGNDDAPVFDLAIDDQVLDLPGTVEVEGNQGFVVFDDRSGNRTKVEVRGWNPSSKRPVIGAGSAVRVTGASAQGKRVEYRGHVTVLK
jgi:hypothetical protein